MAQSIFLGRWNDQEQQHVFLDPPSPCFITHTYKYTQLTPYFQKISNEQWWRRQEYTLPAHSALYLFHNVQHLEDSTYTSKACEETGSGKLEFTHALTITAAHTRVRTQAAERLPGMQGWQLHRMLKPAGSKPAHHHPLNPQRLQNIF